MAVLSPAAHAALNAPARIAERDMWFSRLQNLFEGKSDPYNDSHVFTLNGVFGRAPETLAYKDPEAYIAAMLEDLAGRDSGGAQGFVPYTVSWPIYGVHFVDRIFGADVFYKDGQWNTNYLTTPVGSLQMPDLETDETWQLTKRAARAFAEADVKLPLFGMPTLASSLNIMINLYGQTALIEMLDDEDAALHDLTVINDLIRTMHRWFRENMPKTQLQPVVPRARTQPPGFGQICGCTTQLISGELYREMIAPLDDAVLGEWQCGGMIHLCGGHTQHIPAFREMKNLRAVQLNDRAAGDLAHYLEGLREDQIIYLCPCAEMPAEEAIRLSGGRRIVLPHTKNAPLKTGVPGGI